MREISPEKQLDIFVQFVSALLASGHYTSQDEFGSPFVIYENRGTKCKAFDDAIDILDKVVDAEYLYQTDEESERQSGIKWAKRQAEEAEEPEK